MRVGKESGTTVVAVNGTKTFTISGLAGKLNKLAISSVVLLRDTGNIVLIAANQDNHPSTATYTVTENLGVYTVDYSGIVTSPALPSLVTGDQLKVDVEIDGLSLTLTTKIDAVKSVIDATKVVVDAIKTEVDTLAGNAIASTTIYNHSILSGYIQVQETGTIFSYKNGSNTDVTHIYRTTDNSEVFIGGAVSKNDVLRVVVPSTGNYTLVLNLINVSRSGVPVISAANSVGYEGALWDAIYSTSHGLVKIISNALVDNNNKLIYNGVPVGGSTTSSSNLKVIGEDDNNFYVCGTTSYSIIKVPKNGSATSTLALNRDVTKIIVTANEIVCVVSAGQSSAIIDKASFTVRATMTGVVSQTSCVVGNFVYIGTSSANIIVYNLTTGIATTPITTAAASTCLFVGSDGYIYAFTASNIYKINPANNNSIDGTLSWASSSVMSCVEYDGRIYAVSSVNNKGITPIVMSTLTAETAFQTTSLDCRVCELYGTKLITANSSGRIRSYELAGQANSFIKETVTVHGQIKTMTKAEPINTLIVGSYSFVGYSTYLLSDLI